MWSFLSSVLVLSPRCEKHESRDQEPQLLEVVYFYLFIPFPVKQALHVTFDLKILQNLYHTEQPSLISP